MSSPYPPSGRATLVLERLPEAPHEPDSVTDAPLVGFDAFSSEHRIFGWVRLSADRLTDLLNVHAELALVNVQVERLSDGRMEWLDRVVIHRDQLVAVRAGGPRGDPARRQRGRLHPLVVKSGSYLIGGYLHARPGVAPLVEIGQRPPMIPLSSASLEYWREGCRVAQWVGTILFNRDLAEAIDVVHEEDLEFGTLTWRFIGRAGRPDR